MAATAQHVLKEAVRMVGLIVRMSGGRYCRFIDVQGTLTPAGRYFYDKKEQRAPDHGFDYTHSQAGQGAAR